MHYLTTLVGLDLEIRSEDMKFGALIEVCFTFFENQTTIHWVFSNVANVGERMPLVGKHYGFGTDSCNIAWFCILEGVYRKSLFALDGVVT